MIRFYYEDRLLFVDFYMTSRVNASTASEHIVPTARSPHTLKDSHDYVLHRTGFYGLHSSSTF